MCKKFKKEKNKNTNYLIFKSPETKNKRCDIFVYLEFVIQKSIWNNKKLEITIKNLNRIGHTRTYTRTVEYLAVGNRINFLSKILLSSGQHHKIKWE